ncbi:MAG: hypothetical protein ACYC8T_35600 [Myxococcaceae bacterium]
MRRLLLLVLALGAAPAGAQVQVVASPFSAQLNGKFAQHYGSSLTLVWSPREFLGLRLTGEYNWVTTESGFNYELMDKVRMHAQAATALLLAGALHAGVELQPLRGELRLGDHSPARFGLVVAAGAGLGSTRLQLWPGSPGKPATYGDAGTRLVGAASVGLRTRLTERLGFRLELQDLFFSSRVSTINGCVEQDLSWDSEPRCRIYFTENFSRDRDIALNRLRVTSSDIVHVASFRAALDFAF